MAQAVQFEGHSLSKAKTQRDELEKKLARTGEGVDRCKVKKNKMFQMPREVEIPEEFTFFEIQAWGQESRGI